MGQQLSNLRNQRRQIYDLQLQLTEQNQVITSLRDQSWVEDQQIINLQFEVAARDQQINDLERQLREKNQDLTNLRNQSAVEDLQITNLQVELAERDQELNDLQRQLSEKNQDITILRNQSTAEDLQITSLQVELAARDQQVTDLQSQIETLTIRVAELEQTHSRDWVMNRNEIRFTREDHLGEGAWGRVFRGKFRRCAVAVKQIHNDILNREYFEREVGMASRCRHPCLLQFIGATNDERPLIVTELMDRSLRSLYEERPLSEREISNITLDVAQALNYLHQNTPDPIIHRDISSSNVLLWRKGNQWRGKVSDYGTANFVRQCARNDPGAVIYCAPEALGGVPNQIVSCKIDVYSFGVLLCEMCIQQLPDPERRDQQIEMVTNYVLRALIRGCVDTEPGLRPDMETIIDGLDAPI